MKSRIETRKGLKPPVARGRSPFNRARKTESLGTSFSLTDLQIPSRRLLTREEEGTLGRRIQTGLRRLRKLLPQTLGGYRMYLQEMAEVAVGARKRVTWFPLKHRVEEDSLKVSKLLERVERLAVRSPKRAAKVLAEGSRILREYPLNPETVFKWSRAVAGARKEEGPLGQLAGPRKALEIVSRTTRIMEESRDEFVLPNFRLVLKDVFRYQPVGMKRSDLVQEGILGLHRAVFRYDPARLTRFSTYATYWIRQAIRKALIDRSRLIRVPQAVQEELRNPETHLSEREVERVQRIMKDTISFSTSEDSDGNDLQLIDTLGEDGLNSTENFHTGTVPAEISRALDFLDSREREIIRRRFGLDGEQHQTLEEIGSTLYLSRERIRQIEAEALDKMSQSHVLRDVYAQLEEAISRDTPSP